MSEAQAPRRVLITGANGFIGSALRERLTRDGVDVRGIDLVPGPGVARGDTTDPTGWAAQLESVDVVVHTAAIVTMAGDPDRFWRVNVLGTRRVLEAAASVGVERAVVLSSIVAYGFDIDGEVDETWPVRTSGAPYVDTKVATEQVTLQMHASGAIETVVIRPGDVYGPGSPPWTLTPVEELRRGRAFLPAGEARLNPVYIDDLVDALASAVSVAGAAGQVLNVTAGQPVAPLEFFTRYARMLGLAPPRQLPLSVLRPAARVLGRVDRLRGRESHLSGHTMAYLARRGVCSNARAREVLGWKPRVDLDEGFHRTEAWLHETGII